MTPKLPIRVADGQPAPTKLPRRFELKAPRTHSRRRPVTLRWMPGLGIGLRAWVSGDAVACYGWATTGRSRRSSHAGIGRRRTPLAAGRWTAQGRVGSVDGSSSTGDGRPASSDDVDAVEPVAALAVDELTPLGSSHARPESVGARPLDPAASPWVMHGSIPVRKPHRVAAHRPSVPRTRAGHVSIPEELCNCLGFRPRGGPETGLATYCGLIRKAVGEAGRRGEARSKPRLAPLAIAGNSRSGHDTTGKRRNPPRC